MKNLTGLSFHVLFMPYIFLGHSMLDQQAGGIFTQVAVRAHGKMVCSLQTKPFDDEGPRW